MFDCSSLSERCGQIALAGMIAFAAGMPGVAEAAWPKTFEAEICWNYTICNGTSVTWTFAADGTFADQYTSTGEYYLSSQFPVWPYADDLLIFYDNGQTSYTGNAPAPVSINEFMNAPTGQEWVELYNFSKKPVNVGGWRLAVGTQSVILGSINIPAKSHVVLTASAANFIAQWGVGTQGVNVIQTALPALPNGAGSLTLTDGSGDVVWQVSYVDDDDAGFSTVLTELDMHHFMHPAVNRDGLDDIDGYVGYESYGSYNDRFDFTSTMGDRGSPLDGHRNTARPLFTGSMITYVFYPPYVIEGFWCEGGC